MQIRDWKVAPDAPRKPYGWFVALAILIAAAGLLYYQQVREQIRAQTQGELASIADLKIGRLTAWRRERMGDVMLLAGNPVFAERIRRFQANPTNKALAAELAGGLDALIRSKPTEYDSVALVDRAGRSMLSVGAGAILTEPEHADELREAIRDGQSRMLDLHTHEGGNVHLSVVAPVPGGAIVGRIQASRFLFPYIQSWPVPSRSAETLLVRRDGDEVVFLNRLRHRNNTEMRLRIPITEKDVPAVAAVLGSVGVFEGGDYRDVRVLSVLRPLPDTPWFLVCKVDQEEVYAPIRERALYTLIVATLLIALSGSAVGVLWKRQEAQYLSGLLDVERKRREVAARYMQLMRLANDAVVLIDRQGSIREVNERALSAYGYTREELTGKHVGVLYSEPDHVDFDEIWRSSQSENGLVFETIHRSKNGTPIPVEISTRVIDVDQEQLRFSIVRDITERRRAEAALRRMNRNLRTLSECNQALIRASNEQELLTGICTLIVETGGYLMASVVFVGKDEASAPSVAAHAGLAYSESKVVNLAAQSIRIGKPVIDRADPDLNTALALPLLVESEVAGGLVLLAGEAHDCGSEEMELLLELAGDLGYGIQTLRLRAHQARTAESLRLSEASLASAQAIASLGSFEFDIPDGEVVWSDETYRIFGVDRASHRPTRESFLAAVVEEDRDRAQAAVHTLLARGSPATLEVRIKRPDGEERQVRILADVLPTTVGSDIRIAGTVQDITEQRRVEELFLQSQKLETVGRLAGGVAHDFNNLLTIINGYCDLLLHQLGEEEEVRKGLFEIRKAGEKAAALTSQLLGFSRRQMRQPVVLDVNQSVEDMSNMLRRLLGEPIDLRTQLSPSLNKVLVDPAHLQQVIMNLAVNAQHAMPAGGTLIIETANVELDTQYVSLHPEASSGPHVMIAVSDTGTGMTEETKRHIFEPFFTTKPKGTGTGLGLATVYGIVKQNGGSIWVYSEPGRGTTFKIYLPVVSSTGEVVLPETPSARGTGGGETILVVEDEAELRALVVFVLQSFGYTVLEASSGEEALRVASEFKGTIHLLISDVIMRGMHGRELGQRMRADQPDLPVLYMSGYTEDMIAQNGVLDEGMAYIQKPFTPSGLASRVREVLDAGA